jgi:predicted MFS family arabinose efflux permease
VAVAKTYAAELAGRVVLGFATGAGECLGALVVTDIYFAHERGAFQDDSPVFGHERRPD